MSHSQLKVSYLVLFCVDANLDESEFSGCKGLRSSLWEKC